MNHKTAALIGGLFMAPFVAANAMVGHRIEPFFSFIRPGLQTSPFEYVLLGLVLGCLPAGAFIAVRPLLARGADGRRGFYIVPRMADQPEAYRSTKVFAYLGVPEAERVGEARMNEIAARRAAPAMTASTMSVGSTQIGTAVPHDLLLQLLRQTLGAGVELAGCKIGNQQHDYLVLLVQLRHPTLKVVVKLAGPAAPLAAAFERTALLQRLVATQTTIPMPETLAVDTSCRAWPWRYFIKTHIPGQEWAAARRQMTGEELSDAYRQIGSAVAQLHTIHFPAFGELTAYGSVQGDQPYPAALQEHARAIIRSARLRELFFSALERQRPLFLDVRGASLCHEDLHRHNILFRRHQGRWRLATILDFDKAWAGHHETDLARLELWRGMTSTEFWGPYEAICPIAPLYRERRALYQLLWCLEYARSTAEHLADTQRLCKELGLPRLERFA